MTTLALVCPSASASWIVPLPLWTRHSHKGTRYIPFYLKWKFLQGAEPFENAQEMTAVVSEETGTILQVVLLYVVHMFGKGVPHEGGV